MKHKRIRIRHLLLVMLVSGGVWQIGEGAYIYAKALLAQRLIHDAWQASIKQSQQVKPWSWADTWPVARLLVPRLGVDQIVLAGDSGRTLAFGPGHRFGSPLPGDSGNSLIAGHRDTHFRFLKEIRSGEVILVQTQNGDMTTYVVNSTGVIHELSSVGNDADQRQLTLVTCYPFGAVVPGGPLRYVVSATEKG